MNEGIGCLRCGYDEFYSLDANLRSQCLGGSAMPGYYRSDGGIQVQLGALAALDGDSTTVN